MKVRKIISSIILIIAIGVFCYSAYRLYGIYSEYKRGDDEYEEVEKIAFASIEAKEEIDLEALKKINDDVIGWIDFVTIPINYPVVKGEDNDFYLTHTFNKEENKSASIFADYMNKGDFTDKNTIIYGHNMKNKSMFGLLNNYKDEDYYKSNPGFYIYDFTGKHYYEIFSCYTVEADGDIYQINFVSDEDFINYVDKAKSRSNYKTDVKIDETDKLILLSTCTTNDDYRFVVHAVRRN